MLTKSRLAQLLFMMIVLLGLFFWRTFEGELSNSTTNTNNDNSEISLLRCDYSSACEFITEQGSFFLDIKNAPVQAEEWIDFELITPFENSEISKAQIVGKSMFMGRIPVFFSKSGAKNYTARGLVGACMTDEMVWELQIEIANGDNNETLLFDFMVKK
ncbi:hypothetical protein ACLKMH_09210 [Psychromonas sp. KJ10-10]|uniref:hypothetical protein n=1 Tax=Psychromonas sp. KJ10-10 TaxID=3391823 RepID=UPI0039B5E8FD